MAIIKLTINGVERTIEAEPDMPLLWALRDLLSMTGTKYGCGIGECGACTVLVDGDPMQSCLLPVSEAVGKAIVTIEGLSTEIGRALQQAWIDEDVSQCGYCQPGQLLSATALLTRKPRPTDSDIDEAMNSNLCRCGTYPRIRLAIKRVSRGIAQ